MTDYYPLRISDKYSETDHAVVLEFELPEELAETFRFQAGQYLNVRHTIDGADVRRSYSICAGPSENKLRVGIKHVPGGKFSTWAMETATVGDTLEIMPPQGRFTLPDGPGDGGQYVFFAAGSGITPVMSLIKHILGDGTTSEVLLFYGNRSTDSIMFREELESLKNRYLQRLSVHHILSQERQNSDLFNGRIDEEKCDVFARIFFEPEKVKRFFICGPEGMIYAIKAWLESRGVGPDRIAFELFGVGQTPSGAMGKSEEKEQPDGTSTVTIRVDGNAMEFQLPYAGDSILDAAMAAGADVPFSCKGGVCCTCKAMLMEGDAEMDVVYGLEPDEIDDGYILTCQAHPRSETVLVDYDV